MLYVSQGRLEDALNILLRARTTHSLWPTVPAHEILIRFFRREFESAVTCGKRALELHPYLYLGHLFYGESLEHNGQASPALEHYRLAVIMSPDLPWLQAVEAACLARQGRRKEATAVLTTLLQIRKTHYVDAYYMAVLLDALGDPDQAFQELERAFHEKSPALFALGVDPRLDNLRKDPRFSTLLTRVFPGKDEPHAVSA
jgi:tetratricopeptide (TPR) repeat protein